MISTTAPTVGGISVNRNGAHAVSYIRSITISGSMLQQQCHGSKFCAGWRAARVPNFERRSSVPYQEKDSSAYDKR